MTPNQQDKQKKKKEEKYLCNCVGPCIGNDKSYQSILNIVINF